MRKTFFRVGISAAFLGLLFYIIRGDVPEILSALKNVHRPVLAAAVGVHLLTVLVLARRLQLIFAVEDIRIPIAECSQLTFVGYFFNNFLPTSVGGDVVKALCAARVTGETMKSVTTVLMDRILGLFTFVLIPGVSLLFFLKHIHNPAVPVLIYSFLFFSFFFFFLIFNRKLARRFQFIETLLHRVRLGDKARRVYEALHNFKNHPRVVTEAMLLSVLGQGIGILVLFLMAAALGVKVDVLYFFLLVPLVHLVSMLPSLNGLGIREGAYLYFLGPVIGRENAAALGILWLGLLILLSILGGVVYLLRHDYHVRFKDAAKSF